MKRTHMSTVTRTSWPQTLQRSPDYVNGWRASQIDRRLINPLTIILSRGSTAHPPTPNNIILGLTPPVDHTPPRPPLERSSLWWTSHHCQHLRVILKIGLAGLYTPPLRHFLRPRTSRIHTDSSTFKLIELFALFSWICIFRNTFPQLLT